MVNPTVYAVDAVDGRFVRVDAFPLEEAHRCAGLRLGDFIP
jgi:hypothetical protein